MTTEMMQTIETNEAMPPVVLRCRRCGWAEHPTNNVRFAAEGEMDTHQPICTACAEERRLRSQQPN